MQYCILMCVRNFTPTVSFTFPTPGQLCSISIIAWNFDWLVRDLADDAFARQFLKYCRKQDAKR